MAEPDCDLCRMMGNRSCDECGGEVFPEALKARPDGEIRELCGYCLHDLTNTV